MNVAITEVPATDVLVYKFGCRLDPDCIERVEAQILLARRLYNDLIEDIRKAHALRSSCEMELAGEGALVLKGRIDVLSKAFANARAANAREAMKLIAAERRSTWDELLEILGGIRSSHKQQLRQFLSRIGRSSNCTTYEIRSSYVAAGLGWATANKVLDSALRAFQETIKRGQPPRFARHQEIVRDILHLQFTQAGGVKAQALLEGRNNELMLSTPPDGSGRRKYARFSMRLGPAKADEWATGTWQVHRDLPEGAHVAGAKLVRERVGPGYRWYLHLLVKVSHPVTKPVAATRVQMAALHLGWAADAQGRRFGAIAESDKPQQAEILQLPSDIEAKLNRSAVLQSERAASRDQVAAALKALPADFVAGLPDIAANEVTAIRKLPSELVAASRLHRLLEGPATRAARGP